MSHRLYTTVVLFTALLGGTAQAGILYDNGGPAVTNQGGSNMSEFIQAEDFILSFNSNLLGITFWNLEAGPADYLGSITWQILADAAGTPGAAVASGLAAPTRSAAGSVLGFNQFQNDFSISPTILAAGTYWLALHNGLLTDTAFTDFYWSFTDFNGTNTPTNRGQEFSLNPVGTGYTTNDQEHAFLVSGEAVPEPSTIVLVLGAMTGLVVRRRRSH